MTKLTAYDKFIQQALKYGFSLFGLPKTGQTTSYRAGDDGTYQKGYPQSGARFVDNGDGTISDNGTGLMWAKDGNGAGCNNGTKLTWNNAISYPLTLTFAGYTDWRLPNIRELSTLVKYNSYNPIIDPIFTNVAAAQTWSSTTKWDSSVYKWNINFSYGYVQYGTGANSFNIRLVRGG